MNQISLKNNRLCSLQVSARTPHWKSWQFSFTIFTNKCRYWKNKLINLCCLSYFSSYTFTSIHTIYNGHLHSRLSRFRSRPQICIWRGDHKQNHICSFVLTSSSLSWAFLTWNTISYDCISGQKSSRVVGRTHYFSHWHLLSVFF